MPTDSTPNENVQAVLDDLNEWTGNEPKLMHYSGDRMRVEIDLSMMCSDNVANLVEWLIDHNWRLHELEMRTQIAEMSGQAY